MSRYQGSRSSGYGGSSNGGGYRNAPGPSSSARRRRSRSPESSAARRKAELDRELDERHGLEKGKEDKIREDPKRHESNKGAPAEGKRDQTISNERGSKPARPVSERSYSSEEGMITPPQRHAQNQTQSVDQAAKMIVTSSTPPASSRMEPAQWDITHRSPIPGSTSAGEHAAPETRTPAGDHISTIADAASPPPVAGFSSITLRKGSSPTTRPSAPARTSRESANLLDSREDDDTAQGRRRGARSASREKGSRSPRKRAVASDKTDVDIRYEQKKRERSRERARERDRDEGYTRDSRYSEGPRGGKERDRRSDLGRRRSSRDRAESSRRSDSRSSRSRSRTPPPRQPPSGPRKRDYDDPAYPSSSRHAFSRTEDASYRRSGADESSPAQHIPSGPSGSTWATKRGGYGTPTRGRGGSSGGTGRDETSGRSGGIPSGPRFRVPPAEIRSRAEVDAERREQAARGNAAAEGNPSERGRDLASTHAARQTDPAPRGPPDVAGQASEDIDMDRLDEDAKPRDGRREPVSISLGVRPLPSGPARLAPPPPMIAPPVPPPPTVESTLKPAARPISSSPSPVAGQKPANNYTSPATPVTPLAHGGTAELPPASFSGSHPGRGVASSTDPARRALPSHSSASPGTPGTPYEDRGSRGYPSSITMPPPSGPRENLRKSTSSPPVNPYGMGSQTPITRPRAESTASSARSTAQVAPVRQGERGASTAGTRAPQAQQQPSHRSRDAGGWKSRPPPKEMERIERKVERMRFEDSKGKVIEFASRPAVIVGREPASDWREQLRNLRYQRDLLTHSFQPLAASFRNIQTKLLKNEDYVLATAMKIDAAAEIEYDRNMGYLSD